MARATFVKSARKDYPNAGIKKGESYYWWAFMIGGRGGPKHFSKTLPKPSQLTGSEFLATLYGASETIDAMKPADFETLEDFSEAVESVKSDLENLKDETDEKFNNMPDGLQQGDTGQLLEARVSGLDELIGEFDSLDKDDLEDGEVLADKIQQLIEEIQGFNWSID